MKKMLVILAAVLAVALVSCSNTSDSGGESFTVVTSAGKSALVGSWLATSSTNGLKGTDLFTVNSNYSGSQKMVIDYSAASATVHAALLIAVSKLSSQGYTYTDDSSTKKVTVTRSFTSTDFETYITQGAIKINEAKNKVKMKDAYGSEGVYTKQ